MVFTAKVELESGIFNFKQLFTAHKMFSVFRNHIFFYNYSTKIQTSFIFDTCDINRHEIMFL